MRSMALLTSLLLGLAACSDDNQGGPTPDQGTDTWQYQDTGAPDQNTDAAADAAKDKAVDGNSDAPASDSKSDAPATDGKSDGKSDGKGTDTSSKPDLAKDYKVDAGAPFLWGYISRSVIPVNDGVGNVHISVSQVLWPFPPIAIASMVIKRADLSKVGTKLKYQLNATVPAGTYTIAAWMDDNNNAWSPLVMAGEGDLIMSKGVSAKVGSAVMKVDLVMDKVSKFGATDAGAGATQLKGKVTSKVIPSGDGKGRIFFTLHSSLPPAGLVAGSGTVLEGADLSSQFLSEAYFYAKPKAGKYYLRVFLDDNGNASTFLGTPKPDKGDMVTAKPVQVHVVSGQLSVRDVVLDALQK